jgi:tetratricopeptide (TPR) repeat protein
MEPGRKFWRCEECGETVPLVTSAITASATAPLEGLDALPSVLALPLHEYATETSPVLRLHRLCDAVEILTRFCVIVAIGELRGLNGGKLPPAVLSEVRPSIEMPTFGKWRAMLDALLPHLPRGGPSVVAEMPGFARTHLLRSLIGGADQPPEVCLLSLRNLLAHGGAMSRAAARRFLEGEPATGRAGWGSWLERLVPHLGFLGDCVLCHHGEEQARRLRGYGPAEPMELSASLRLAVRPLAGHVLLVRRERWLDLWPFCDFGPARMTSSQGPRDSATPASQVFFRAEKTRLLYAALGVEVPLGERRDLVAEFRDLFQLHRRQTIEITRPDYDDDIEGDANALVGREEELRAARGRIKGCPAGVLWLTGPGGIGKSFLVAKLASGYGLLRPAVPNRPQSKKWCAIVWRFRAGDGDRCHRHAFFRHAISRLGQWESIGRPGTVPTAETYKLQEQLSGLLDRVAELKPDDPRGGPPRVLFVLDGLDEIARGDRDFAEVPFQLHRGNVVWLCAGRPEETLDRVFRPERCTPLFAGGLERMRPPDIRAMLVDGTGKLKYDLLKQDDERGGEPVNAPVDAVVDRADGLPLYVRFVVEDVLAGHLTFDATLPGKLPRGLSAYYDDMLRRFAIGELQALLTPLVVSVAWAKAPLEEETLLELMLRRKVLLAGGEEVPEQTLRRGLDVAGVMLRVVPLSGGGFGYEPYHLTFRDHVRADAARIIGVQNRLARQEFCDLACDWARLGGGHAARRYVLRHGPEHLLEENRYEDLFRLARDREGFLLAQSRELPAEPEAPLRTLMAALQGAIAREDGGLMAEFCIGHALRAQEILRESPLEALRAGSLERALGLVELLEPQRRLLGLLLLLWELRECGRNEEAGTVSARLLRGEVPLLTDWMGEHAGTILGHIATAEDGPEDLWERVLGDDAARQSLTSTLGGIAESQAKSGEGQSARRSFSAALDIARTIGDAGARARALQAIGESQTRAGDTREARQSFAAAFALVQTIENVSSRTSPSIEIAECQARAGDAEAALATVQTIRAECGRARALAAIAESEAKRGDPQAARRFFADALATAQTIREGDRARPFRWIAARQAQAGDAEAALATAQTIREEWARAGALRMIAVSQNRAGDAQGARRSFAAALAAARTIHHEGTRVRVTAETAANQAEAEDAEGARQSFAAARAVVRTIRPVEDRDKALRWIAESLAQAGDTQAARTIARSITHGTDRARALRLIAASQARAGDDQGARQSFADARDSAQTRREDWVRAGALREIAESQTRAGDTRGARQSFAAALAQRISNEWGRTKTLRSIAASQARAGDTQGARHSFAALRTAARAISDEGDRARALQVIAECQAREGDTQGALATARTIRSAQLLAGALLVIAESQAQAGDAQGARQSFADALDTARAIGEANDRARQLIAIAVGQAKTGDTLAALTTARTISATLQTVHQDPAWSDALRLIAASQAQAGDFQAALTTARTIPDEGIRATALGSIAASQARAGDAQGARQSFADALDAARSISKEWNRDTPLSTIAESQLEAGDAEGARESFAAALASARATPGPDIRAWSLTAIAARQARGGDAEGARQSYAAAIAAARTIGVDVPRACRLREIATSQAQAGDTQAALAIARTITAPWFRVGALRSIAESQAGATDLRAGRQSFSAAVETARTISDEHGRASALQAIAASQAKAEDFSGIADTAASIRLNRNEHLPAIAAELVEAAQTAPAARTAFLRLLAMCAPYLDASVPMCGHLAVLFPASATAIAKLVIDLPGD